MPSDWVNWQDYADAVKPEEQRLADEREAQDRGTQQAIGTDLATLQGQQDQQVKHHNYQGVDKLGSYSDVMEQAKTGRTDWNARQGAASPWESLLQGGQDGKPPENPWDQLDSRLGQLGDRGTQAVAKRDAAEQAKADAAAKAMADKQAAQQAAAQKAQDTRGTPQDLQNRRQFETNLLAAGGADGPDFKFYKSLPPEVQDEAARLSWVGSTRGGNAQLNELRKWLREHPGTPSATGQWLVRLYQQNRYGAGSEQIDESLLS